MRTIIAGSRNIRSYQTVFYAIKKSGFDITHIIAGGAYGVDTTAIEIAEDLEIPYTVMPADWDTHGKSAGFRRNSAMAAVADALIAVWDGESKGTSHMILVAKARGLKVYVHNITAKNLK